MEASLVCPSGWRVQRVQLFFSMNLFDFLKVFYVIKNRCPPVIFSFKVREYDWKLERKDRKTICTWFSRWLKAAVWSEMTWVLSSAPSDRSTEFMKSLFKNFPVELTFSSWSFAMKAERMEMIPTFHCLLQRPSYITFLRPSSQSNRFILLRNIYFSNAFKDLVGASCASRKSSKDFSSNVEESVWWIKEKELGALEFTSLYRRKRSWLQSHRFSSSNSKDIFGRRQEQHTVSSVRWQKRFVIWTCHSKNVFGCLSDKVQHERKRRHILFYKSVSATSRLVEPGMKSSCKCVATPTVQASKDLMSHCT